MPRLLTQIFVILAATAVANAAPEGSCTADPDFGADTSFILIARMTVKADKVDEYLKLAEETDTAVMNSEPGMLHHTFDVDPDTPNSFVWSEVYSSDAALIAHLTNPPVGSYVEKHGELGETFTVEIYGTLDDKTKAIASTLPFPVKYFDTKFGYSRMVRWPTSHETSKGTYGTDSPFILIARMKVKSDKVDEYLELAKKTDSAVQDSEPGMLHHTFDVDPDTPASFVWSELYRNDAALLAHLSNPPVGTYVEKHGELGESFTVEIYGTLDDETKEAANGLPFPVKYFDTKFGYNRGGSWPTPPAEE